MQMCLQAHCMPAAGGAGGGFDICPVHDGDKCPVHDRDKFSVLKIMMSMQPGNIRPTCAWRSHKRRARYCIRPILPDREPSRSGTLVGHFKFTAQHRDKRTTAEVCAYVDLG